jgi:D-serine deaminase-like pyridoxal phosphate-dependent protein
VLDDAGVLARLIQACRAAGVVIGYLWEVDCGTGRLGTAPGEATTKAIASAPRGPECPFQGLMTFGGHAYAAADDADLDRAAEDERDALEASAEALRGAGIDCPVRSAGTTPTAHRMGTRTAPTITEMRPGNYVFYDATQVALGLIEPSGCALTVLATVIGRPDRRRVILDAGSKALSAERLTPRAPGFGLVLGHPELTVERLYEQHAIAGAPHGSGLQVGDRVRIVPNHACTTANLHRRALVAENDDVVDVWSIAAAGPGG